MDTSKLKLEVYEFLGLLVPGLVAIGETWIFINGWDSFSAGLRQLSGSALTLVAIGGLPVGHLIAEFGDFAIGRWKGKRYLKSARDRFWATAEAHAIQEAIRTETGTHAKSVDSAFDHCFTKVKDGFAKRDIFVATSDLNRSLVVLAFFGILPLTKAVFWNGSLAGSHFAEWFIGLGLLAGAAALAWRRMLRFRELSDATVFRAFLARDRVDPAAGPSLVRTAHGS